MKRLFDTTFESLKHINLWVSGNSLSERASLFEMIANSYDKAAQTFFEATFTRRGYSDFDIFPVVFLCRHATELRLKGIILLCCELAGKSDKGQSEALGKHDLFPIYEAIKQVWPYPGKAIFSNEVIQALREWDNLDKSGMGFRYAVSKEGNLIIPNDKLVSANHFMAIYEEIRSQTAGQLTGLGEALNSNEIFQET
jgi:hypothetical protein